MAFPECVSREASSVKCSERRSGEAVRAVCGRFMARTQGPVVGVQHPVQFARWDPAWARGVFRTHVPTEPLWMRAPHACPCAFRRSTGDGRLDSKSELAFSSVLGKLLVQTSVPGATGSLPHTHLLRNTWSQAFYPECHELIDHLNWFLCRLLNLLPVNGCVVHSYLRFVTSGGGCSWSPLGCVLAFAVSLFSDLLLSLSCG